MDPDAAHPGAQVDHVHDEDAPLVGFPGGVEPGGVEPGGLAEHAEDAGPAAQLLAAGLGQPGCEGAEQGDGDLVEFHAVIVHDWMQKQYLPLAPTFPHGIGTFSVSSFQTFCYGVSRLFGSAD